MSGSVAWRMSEEVCDVMEEELSVEHGESDLVSLRIPSVHSGLRRVDVAEDVGDVVCRTLVGVASSSSGTPAPTSSPGLQLFPLGPASTSSVPLCPSLAVLSKNAPLGSGCSGWTSSGLGSGCSGGGASCCSASPTFYKPVNITPTRLCSTRAPQTVRISASVSTPVVSLSGSARLPSQPIALSLSHTSLSVPLVHSFPQTSNVAATLRIPAPPVSTAPALHQGKLIAVSATPSVTIQKSSVPPQPQLQPRTISLPYAQATALPLSKASLPIARVCPQPSAVPTAINLSTTNKGQVMSPFFEDSSTHRKVGTLSLPPQPARVQPLPSAVSAVLQNSNENFPTTIHTQLNNQLVTLTSSTTVCCNPLLSLPSHKVINSSRPGILRRREGERDSIISDNADCREDESLSSGSTTLSATSSPGFGNSFLSGGEETINTTKGQQATSQVILNDVVSPRKKPRKQNFTSIHLRGDGSWNEVDYKRKKSREIEVGMDVNSNDFSKDDCLPRRNFPQLISSYNQSWKSCHNHFLRYTDVKEKEERRPTVNELASHRYVAQQINGWKIYHLFAQMEDVSEMEDELTEKLSELQKRLEDSAHSEINLSKVQEMIKANLQRSKIVRDQVGESKTHLLNIFNHKPKILNIINKYVVKRQHKRREVKNV
ncbi:SAP130 [Lepeophtheirus salmonis]|uniref:SAP130 n=1 Tax=Lepeophtheirus salmonis TaxID=72036 RepID=A0A7R8CGU2_LEPSM|nr:SAP130 [Lepeophtheirus salmonis]CAF2818257.1 SAP130 [Lepeophtheirus salmonis]